MKVHIVMHDNVNIIMGGWGGGGGGGCTCYQYGLQLYYYRSNIHGKFVGLDGPDTSWLVDLAETQYPACVCVCVCVMSLWFCALISNILAPDKSKQTKS